MSPLIAHYPLSEDSGSTAYDHSGNGNDGTANGAGPSGTGTVAGPLGSTAYDFDGSDDGVSIGNSIITAGGGESFSVSCWINADDLSSNRVFYSENGDSTSDGFQLYHTTTDWGFIVIDNSDNSNFVGWSDTTTNSWVHVVGTADATSGNIKIYGNGIERGSLSSWDGTFNHSGINAEIGVKGDGSAHHDGAIFDARVYDHALSPSEVSYLYNVTNQQRVATATKTHTASVKPSLEATVTLNGESATAVVRGSPGTASEEYVTVTLNDGTNTYSPTWTSGHTDFRIDVIAEIGTITNAVDVSSLTLKA